MYDDHDDYDEIELMGIAADFTSGNSRADRYAAEQREREREKKRDSAILSASLMAGGAYLLHQSKKHRERVKEGGAKCDRLKAEEQHAKAMSVERELMRTEAYALQEELADAGLNYTNTLLEQGPIRKWDIEDAQLWLYQFGRNPDLYATLVVIQNGFDFSKKTVKIGDEDFSKILEPFKRKVQRKGGKPYFVYSNQQYFFDDADIVRVNTEDPWDAVLKTQKRVQGEINSMARQARNMPISRSSATRTGGVGIPLPVFWVIFIIIIVGIIVGFYGCVKWLGLDELFGILF